MRDGFALLLSQACIGNNRNAARHPKPDIAPVWDRGPRGSFWHMLTQRRSHYGGSGASLLYTTQPPVRELEGCVDSPKEPRDKQDHRKTGLLLVSDRTPESEWESFMEAAEREIGAHQVAPDEPQQVA
jgi:hypothetical protein